MRRIAPFSLLFGLMFACTGGCGKKPAPVPDTGGGVAVQPEEPADPAAVATAPRVKLLAGLKSNSQDIRRNAIEDLSWLAEDDPAVLPALVELLKDKGTGKQTRADQINSTREAAALAILKCTKGDAVMKEKGFPVLRAELSNPSAAIREHTAYTIGQLGPIAKPLAPDVQKLCTDPNDNVRGVAFDTLRVTGVADPVALAKLLTHKEEDIVRLAAELIPLMPNIPAEAIAPLTEALANENSNVRFAAAEGLAAAGPKAAPAAQMLADTVKKSYPPVFDPKTTQFDGPEVVYWKALTRIGEPAVGPTSTLLDHSNALVQSHAARTLGEIGAPAKSAKDALKKALGHMRVEVAVEAAVALCKLGEAQQDAIDLMKKALDYPTERVAGYAIEAIPRMGDTGKQLVPLALAKMGDMNRNTRAAAVWLVGQLPPEEAAKAAAEVGKRTADDVPEIRLFAGRILAQIGPAGAPAADALGQALLIETDDGIRDQFVEALIAIGPGAKPALRGLLPLVTEKGLPVGLRAKAALACAIVDPASPAVSAVLVKAAGDSEQDVRAAAADAMSKLNPLPPTALDPLVKMAKSDSKNGPRVAALRAMAVAGPRAKAAKAELDAMAAGPQPAWALWAQVASAAVDGNIASAAPAVTKGLRDRNVQVRGAAAETLLLIGPKPDDFPALLKLLTDANGSTRAAAATGIGRLGAVAKEAVPQLARLLEDREAEVRIAAAETLGGIGSASKPAVSKLKELRADPLVRFAAQRALDKIGAK